MNLLKFSHQKSKAQAMVEFAIALPVLLMLLYGIIETGRFLFIYSSVVTASREAVRYGSATGTGAVNANVSRYDDCDGIRAAAQKVGFLGAFNTIEINYDSGPGTALADTNTPPTICAGSTSTWTPTGNTSRIQVKVVKHFTALLPKLLPFVSRDITATSARTILYKVSIVVTQPPLNQHPTTITITSDNPDPSELNQNVQVTFVVTDTVAAPGTPTTPTGDVVITVNGDPATCTYTLKASDNGVGACTISFTSTGSKPIKATYNGDSAHLTSTANESHIVQLAPTTTTIVSQLPSPSAINQGVSFTVTVTGGSTTPTGTVNVSAGGNTCVVTLLSNGIGSCTINFSQVGNFTVTATYPGDATHDTSTGTATQEVLSGTATPSNTPGPTKSPTPTLSPTPTRTPTPAASPTITATPVPACNGITHGPITKSGNTMSMTITNPYNYPLTTGAGSVTWNADKGHQVGTDKSLSLQSIVMGTTTLWTGSSAQNVSTMPWTTPAVIPANSTITIVFTFQQSYDNFDGTESITINVITNGCSGVIIQS